MSKEISKFDDLIDSRDVIKRIEELQGELDDLQESVDQATAEYQEAAEDAEIELCAGLLEDAKDALEVWDAVNREELDSLLSLQAEAEGYSDWQHGATLVHESYFTRYAMDLLSDIGDLPREVPWYIVIDEDATAENIRADYTSVDFAGQQFWVRS